MPLSLPPSRQQQLAAQVEAAAKAGEARVGELEQQVQALDSLLQGANADVTRLRSELAAREAMIAADAGPSASARGRSTSASLARQPGGGRGRAGGEPRLHPLRLLREPESLAITFEVNSSYLPANLDGRLRELAEGLEPGRGYEVELVGSVGNDDVAGKSAEEALRYNRWMAERRVSRVAEFLQKNAKADKLTIQQDFALERPVAPGTGRGPAALGLAQAGGTGRGRRCSSMATKVNSAPVTWMHLFAVAGATPCRDVEHDRGAADLLASGVDRHLVADMHRLEEGEALHGDGGAAAAGAPGGDVAGGEVHLRHQPAAEDVAGRVGVGRHGDGADRRIAHGQVHLVPLTR